MKPASLKAFFDEKADLYNRPAFIKDDPICVPHDFSKKQDIEIAGFFASIFAWGNRTTIISKSRELMQLMDRRPHEFCLHHSDAELKKLLGFKHRTFNSTDLLYFIAFLQFHYSRYDSLEDAFLMGPDQGASSTVENNLIHFHEYFFFAGACASPY